MSKGKKFVSNIYSEHLLSSRNNVRKVTFRNKNSYLSSKKCNDLNFKTLSFDLIFVFHIVVIEGNMKLASERLFVTQPAITLTIQKLEQRLGCLLFDQSLTKKTIKLTAEGLLLFNYTQRLFFLIHESLELLRNQNTFYLQKRNNQLETIPEVSKQKTMTVINTNRHKFLFAHQVFKPKLKFILTSLLTLSPTKFNYFENKLGFFIVQRKSFQRQNTRLKICNINISDTALKLITLNDISTSSQHLLAFFEQKDLIEVHNTIGLKNCIELKIESVLCWGNVI